MTEVRRNPRTRRLVIRAIFVVMGLVLIVTAFNDGSSKPDTQSAAATPTTQVETTVTTDQPETTVTPSTIPYGLDDPSAYPWAVLETNGDKLELCGTTIDPEACANAGEIVPDPHGLVVDGLRVKLTCRIDGSMVYTDTGQGYTWYWIYILDPTDPKHVLLEGFVNVANIQPQTNASDTSLPFCPPGDEGH